MNNTPNERDSLLMPIDRSLLDQHLLDLKDWIYIESSKEVCKVFEFKNYYKTIAFVNMVAWIAQKNAHHPDLKVSYGKCEIKLTTHDAINGQAVTLKDIQMIREIESIVF